MDRVSARGRFSHAQADLLQESSELVLPVLSSVTSAVRALSHQPTLLAAWSSPVKLDEDSALRVRIEARSPHNNNQEHRPLLVPGRCLRDDELHPSRGDVALNKSSLGPVIVLLRDPARFYVGTLRRSLVLVRPACLGGVLPCLLPALAHGDLFKHRVLLYVLHLLLARLPNRDGVQPSFS